MAFIPIPGVARIALRFTQAGQQEENIIDCQYPGGALAEVDANSMKDLIEAWYSPGHKALISNSVTLQEIDIRDMATEEGPRFTYPVTGGAGGYNTNPCPNETTIAVRKNTAVGGRNGRGRLYHIGLCTNMCAGNNLLAEFATPMLDSYSQLFGAFNENDYPWVVSSLYYHGAPRETGIAHVVTSLSLADLVLDSQRRRKPGNGG